MNWQTVLAIDFDKWAAQTYRANFPGVRVECGDVQERLDALRYPYADVLLGGPPCQPHSHAGKRKASEDRRDCGPHFAEAVNGIQPRMFLMENVEGLMTSEGGRYAQRLMKRFEDAGYVVQVRVQDAVSFGVPQFRVRCWWWGIRKDLYAAGVRHCWPKPTHAWPPPTDCMFGAALLPGVTVRQALGLSHDLLATGAAYNCRGKGSGGNQWRNVAEPAPAVNSNGLDGLEYDHGVCVPDMPAVTMKAGGNYDRNGKQGGGCPPVLAYRWSDEYRAKHPPIEPDAPSQTVQAQWHKGEPNGCLLVDTKQKRTCRTADEPAPTVAHDSRHHFKDGVIYIRRLTPAECLRLQSGPDSFVWPDGISKTNQYKVIGNGWACGHGAVFSAALRAADPDARTVIDLFCGGGLGACGWHGNYWRHVAEVAA